MSRRKKPPAIDLAELLERPVRVTVNGTPQIMQPFEAELEHCLVQALAGNIAACSKIINWFRREGLIVKLLPLDEHEYRIIVPEDWDWNEFMAMYDKKGPPPWSGERDGLTADDRERRRANRKSRRS